MTRLSGKGKDGKVRRNKESGGKIKKKEKKQNIEEARSLYKRRSRPDSDKHFRTAENVDRTDWSTSCCTGTLVHGHF